MADFSVWEGHGVIILVNEHKEVYVADARDTDSRLRILPREAGGIHVIAPDNVAVVVEPYDGRTAFWAITTSGDDEEPENEEES